jgi:hypothetical protein
MKNKKILTMISTGLMASLVVGMGAMTYSKYITSTTVPTQQATAAKWGFVVTADASGLFANAYDNATPESTKVASKVAASDNKVSVKADSDGLIVAPGTTGSMSIAISGQAEVMAALKVTANATTGEFGIAADLNYHPIVWTVTGGSLNTSGSLGTVLAALAGTSTTIYPGDNQGATYTISWSWAFDSTVNNVYDTAIGYKSAGKEYDEISQYISGAVSKTEYESIVSNIEFDLSVSIEQIQ